MTTSSTPRTVDPLIWGHGPRTLEVFLEPTCPFSARAFGKLDALLASAGEDRLTIKIRLLSQPWHCFSPTTTRAVLAAATTTGGRHAAKAVLAAIFAHRSEFEPNQHCNGPLLDQSPRGILASIERYSGVALTAAFEDPVLTSDVKWHAKYARQNGIHASPTFMVDGIVTPDMSSGEEVETWLAKLGLGSRPPSN